MTGAEAVLRGLARQGVRFCFSNPGTTELPLVASMDLCPDIVPVLCLAEGVATGAADGYGRMTGKPAITLLHLGPGLSNGMANLHNARRARTPILNIVGDHPTWHRAADPPLASDIEGLARTVSKWVRTSRSATDLAGDGLDALEATRDPVGSISTLVAPIDVQSGLCPGIPEPESRGATAGRSGAVNGIARALSGGGAIVLLGGRALLQPGLAAASRIARVTGCRLVVETFPARVECGIDRPKLSRLPYVPDLARQLLSTARVIILAGANRPVAYFAKEGTPSSLLPPNVPVLDLADFATNIEVGLEEVVRVLGASKSGGVVGSLSRPAVPTDSRLSSASIAAAIASVQPEGAIVIDEGMSSAGAYLDMSAGCPPHSYLTSVGGSTGFALPASVGCALACPGRPVIALVGDGSALYSLQALWTQAHHRLNVTTIVCVNDSYRILQLELESAFGDIGVGGKRLTDFLHPRLDWPSLARAFGTPVLEANSPSALASSIRASVDEQGPHLILLNMRH